MRAINQAYYYNNKEMTVAAKGTASQTSRALSYESRGGTSEFQSSDLGLKICDLS